VPGALEIVILTAVRTGDLRFARWCEFDFHKQLWTVVPVVGGISENRLAGWVQAGARSFGIGPRSPGGGKSLVALRRPLIARTTRRAYHFGASSLVLKLV
jgi:integrase